MGETINISLVIALSVGTSCFLMYWFIAHAHSFQTHLGKIFTIDIATQYLPFFQKGFGTLLIGIIPGLILWAFRSRLPGEYGLVLSNPKATLLWILIFGGTLFFITYISARKDAMQAFYPQIRIEEWNTRLLVLNTIVWAVYLFAYEFLFRSFLLNSFLISLDTTSAIILTTVISVTTHMPKGAAETFGTIPFSIVLCLAMIFTGSIWAGFMIHLILALSNDYWALHFNPKMKIISKAVAVNEY